MYQSKYEKDWGTYVESRIAPYMDVNRGDRQGSGSKTLAYEDLMLLENILTRVVAPVLDAEAMTERSAPINIPQHQSQSHRFFFSRPTVIQSHTFDDPLSVTLVKRSNYPIYTPRTTGAGGLGNHSSTLVEAASPPACLANRFDALSIGETTVSYQVGECNAVVEDGETCSDRESLSLGSSIRYILSNKKSKEERLRVSASPVREIDAQIVETVVENSCLSTGKEGDLIMEKGEQGSFVDAATVAQQVGGPIATNIEENQVAEYSVSSLGSPDLISGAGESSPSPNRWRAVGSKDSPPSVRPRSLSPERIERSAVVMETETLSLDLANQDCGHEVVYDLVKPLPISWAEECMDDPIVEEKMERVVGSDPENSLLDGHGEGCNSSVDYEGGGADSEENTGVQEVASSIEIDVDMQDAARTVLSSPIRHTASSSALLNAEVSRTAGESTPYLLSPAGTPPRSPSPPRLAVNAHLALSSANVLQRPAHEEKEDMAGGARKTMHVDDEIEDSSDNGEDNLESDPSTDGEFATHTHRGKRAGFDNSARVWSPVVRPPTARTLRSSAAKRSGSGSSSGQGPEESRRPPGSRATKNSLQSRYPKLEFRSTKSDQSDDHVIVPPDLMTKPRRSCLKWMKARESGVDESGRKNSSGRQNGGGGILSYLPHSDALAATVALIKLASHSEVDRDVRGKGLAKGKGGTLIICSKPEIETWKSLLEAGNDLKILSYTATVRERRKISLERLAEADVVLTTYDILKASEVTLIALAADDVDSSRGASQLHRIFWRRVIADEAQHIAASETPRARAAVEVKGSCKWCILHREDLPRVTTSTTRLRSLFNFVGVSSSLPLAMAQTLAMRPLVIPDSGSES